MNLWLVLQFVKRCRCLTASGGSDGIRCTKPANPSHESDAQSQRIRRTVLQNTSSHTSSLLPALSWTRLAGQMLLRAHLFVSKRCQSKMKNSVLIVMAVMAGMVIAIVVIVVVVVGEAGAAEHSLAKIVRFNVSQECLGDMKTENIW